MTQGARLLLLSVDRTLAFTRYSFASRLLCTNQPSLSCPPSPLAFPTRLQHSCNTLAQSSTPLRLLVVMSYIVHYCSPPLACIFGMSRLYFTCIPPVSHRILDIPCIPVSILYLSMLQQIHCIPLYPTVSSCIRTYLAVSSCILLYLTVSHRLENGI